MSQGILSSETQEPVGSLPLLLSLYQRPCPERECGLVIMAAALGQWDQGRMVNQLVQDAAEFGC